MAQKAQIDRVVEIALDIICPCAGNRKVGGFDKKKLEQLAESIRIKSANPDSEESVGCQTVSTLRFGKKSASWSKRSARDGRVNG